MKPKKTLAQMKALVERAKKVQHSPAVKDWLKNHSIGIPSPQPK